MTKITLGQHISHNLSIGPLTDSKQEYTFFFVEVVKAGAGSGAGALIARLLTLLWRRAVLWNDFCWKVGSECA